MDLRDKIRILYGMLNLVEDFEIRELFAFAILRYIAGWGAMDFGENEALADAFTEVIDFLGDFE